MMRLMFRALLAGLLLFATATANADKNDLVLKRLGNPIVNSNGQTERVVGNNQLFRSLMSEFGVVMAPRLLEPADTLGFAGFQFSVDVAFTSISAKENYWDVLEGENNGTMTTIGFFARKGIWLPFPSFEIGIGAVRLANSKTWSAQGYAKFALHEGYHLYPLPSLSIRGAVSRLMGSEQIDLTIGSLDIVASKSIGLGGIINLTPFVGWNLLFIVPRSEVLDFTPRIDALVVTDDISNNFVFPNQNVILRNRFFGGLKFKYFLFFLTAEVNVALAGTSSDDQASTDMDCTSNTSTTTDLCDSIDQSAAQQTYTISLGLDF